MKSLPKMQRYGLAVLGLLSVADLALPFLTDGDHPPMSIALISLGVGVVTLACLPRAWRDNRSALAGVVASRLLSALLTLPAFFLAGVPAGVVAASVGIVALTVLGVVIALAGARRAVTA
jgi:O-antigen/teichoic acid export membrane protein